MEIFIKIFEFTVFSFFCFVSIYTFLLTIAGWVGYKSHSQKPLHTGSLKRIAILVPAYREDAVIIKVAAKLSSLRYSKDSYKVFVIADSMKKSTVDELKGVVEVIEVDFEKSTKSKSLNYALDYIKEDFDVVVISDGDNILDEDFLGIINAAFSRGFDAVQGQRIAKNTNTNIAILDAASEAINNHVYRRGLNGLGLSSPVIGSGMAFDYHLFKELMSENQAIGGFDKVLQLELLKRRVKIHYLDNAIVFDEKVESSQAFKNQRKRWISAQLKYLSRNFMSGWKSLFTGNFDYFNIAILCGVMPPRILMIGILFLISIAVLIFNQLTSVGFIYWLGLFAFYILTLLICIPRIVTHRAFLRALLELPSTFISMILALVGIGTADKRFIHTSHSNTDIENIFHNRKE